MKRDDVELPLPVKRHKGPHLPGAALGWVTDESHCDEANRPQEPYDSIPTGPPGFMAHSAGSECLWAQGGLQTEPVAQKDS